MRKMDFYGSYFFGCFLRHASATATAAHASTGQRPDEEASATISCCKPFTKLPQPAVKAEPMREKKPSGSCVGLHFIQVIYTVHCCT